MYGLMLTLAGLALAADPDPLPSDVAEIQTRNFLMPLMINKAERIDTIRLYVSKDGGITWQHLKDYSIEDKHVSYDAPHDGLYWFALQIVMKDGSVEPPKPEDLARGPTMKVYVKTARMALKPAPNNESQVEFQQLRQSVEQLLKRSPAPITDPKRK